MNSGIVNYDPHYTNDRFKHAQTVWGSPEDGLHYDYSDRIWQWDYALAESAATLASNSATVRTAKWVEIYLTAYFGKPTKIRHILAGFNASNGYPYQVFGYKLE